MLRGLHKLCDKAHWAEVVEAVESKRFDANEKGGFGEWTPLHLACRRDPPLEVVTALLAAAPATASIADIHGRYPLHLAAERGCAESTAVLAALVEANPPSVGAVDAEGMTPLHLALSASNRESRQKRPVPEADELNTLLGTELIGSKASKVGGVGGAGGAGVTAVASSVSTTNPASKPDAGGNLPLHLLCDNIDDASIESLTTLVRRNPAAVSAQNADGHTPLHLAFLKAADGPPSLEAVEALLPPERAAEVCSIKDCDGLLVLHAACRNFASFEVLQTLLMHNPRGAAESFGSGRKGLVGGGGVGSGAVGGGSVVMGGPVGAGGMSGFGVGGTGGDNDDQTYAIDVLESLRPSVLNEEELEDLNFKSDLLFAAHPYVLPYRLEEERMMRMIDLIVYEATEEEEEGAEHRDGGTERKLGLSPSAASVWCFLCTFPEEEDPSELYLRTVQQIVDELDSDTLRMLGNLPIDGKEDVPVRKRASPKIAALLNCTFRFVDRFEFDPVTIGGHGSASADSSGAVDVSTVLHTGATSLLIKAWDYGSPHLESATKKDGAGGGGGADFSIQQRTRVVIKLESDTSKYLREMEALKLLPAFNNSAGDSVVGGVGGGKKGKGGGDTGGVVPVLCTFDVDRIGTGTETPGDVAYVRDMELAGQGRQEHLPRCLDGFVHKHAMVMPLGDKNLADVLAHEWKSSLSRDRTDFFRECAEKMARSIALLHANKVVHCKLTFSSFVRVDGELLLTGMDSAVSTKRRNHHPASGIMTGVDHTGLDVGTLPPDMFVELGSSEVIPFCRYWGSVMKDSQVASILRRSPDFDVMSKIKSFLGTVEEWEKVDALFDRFELHRDLWAKIIPRRTVGGDGKERFHVVRCARLDEKTHQPFATSLLPYKLSFASEGDDIWSFGLLLFRMLTGRDFFAADRSGNLKDDDFVKLATWSHETAWDEVMKEGIISNPMARDLLRKLLVPVEDRISSIGEVFGHPYFRCGERDDASRPIRTEIVKREESKFEESRRKAKELAQWLSERTTVIGDKNPVTLDLQFRLLNSSEALWDRVCVGSQKTNHPTNFSLLPYKLLPSETGSEPIISVADEERGKALLSSVANVLLYTHTVAQFLSADKETIETRKVSCQEMLADFFSRGREGYESKVVPICERILKRAKSAELILFNVLNDVVKGAAPLARKLVLETVDEVVHYQRCADIVEKAREAERAFAVLFGGFVQHSSRAARDAVAENLAGVFGSDFCKKLFHDAPKVDAALSSLLSSFVEDPVVAAKSLLQIKLEELVGIIGSAEKLYFYLVDEGDATPLFRSPILVGKKKSEALRTLLPAFFLSMKSIYAVHSIKGLANAFGLNTESLDRKRWLRTIQCSFGAGNDRQLPVEFDTVQQVVQGFYHLGAADPKKSLVDIALENLAHLEHFLEEKDPQRNFSNLRRLKVSDGCCLWVSESQEEEMVRMSASAMDEYIKNKHLDAISFLGGDKSGAENTTSPRHRRATSANASPRSATNADLDQTDSETVATYASASTLNSDAPTVIQSYTHDGTPGGPSQVQQHRRSAMTTSDDIQPSEITSSAPSKPSLNHDVVPTSVVSKKKSLFGIESGAVDPPSRSAKVLESTHVSPRRAARHKALWK